MGTYKYLISACLCGENCRYDGGSNPFDLRALQGKCRLVPVCPEQLGGLPTPRTPAERRNGRVIARDGADVTDAFSLGAFRACETARSAGAVHALMKARSPSCGSGEIYDGSFTGKRVPGDGVTVEALRRMGVKVYNEHEIDRLIMRLEDDSVDPL